LEELDAPGEWFLAKSKSSGVLSLWHKSDGFQTRGVIASKWGRIIEIKGLAAQNQWVVTITGFLFTCSTYA
jgi:hypothetical protein